MNADAWAALGWVLIGLGTGGALMHWWAARVGRRRCLAAGELYRRVVADAVRARELAADRHASLEAIERQTEVRHRAMAARLGLVAEPPS